MARGVMASAAAAWLLIAAPAEATLSPDVLYKPPILKALDYFEHNSVENVVVSRNGASFELTNTPSGFGISQQSDKGCTYITAGVSCPVAGLERLVVRLGPMADSAQMNPAASVKQKVVGGPGADTAVGKGGKQRLLGGEGPDVLRGGPGPDVLIGGPGNDTCRGGPGRDVIKSCE